MIFKGRLLAEFQQSYFKSYKMIILKCYTHYISKFWKPRSGHRSGKGQSSPIPKKESTWKLWQTSFFSASQSLWMLTAAMKLKDSLEEKLWKPWQHGKKQRHHFTNKGSYCQSYGFSSSNVWMWMFDHKDSWVPKNWFFGLWCWRRLLSVPWNARRSSQSILK